MKCRRLSAEPRNMEAGQGQDQGQVEVRAKAKLQPSQAAEGGRAERRRGERDTQKAATAGVRQRASREGTFA